MLKSRCLTNSKNCSSRTRAWRPSVTDCKSCWTRWRAAMTTSECASAAARCGTWVYSPKKRGWSVANAQIWYSCARMCGGAVRSVISTCVQNARATNAAYVPTRTFWSSRSTTRTSKSNSNRTRAWKRIKRDISAISATRILRRTITLARVASTCARSAVKNDPLTNLVMHLSFD